MDRQTRIKLKPRQRHNHPQRLLKHKQTSPNRNRRHQQSKKNLHNPKVHRQTFPLQQAEVRYQMLHAPRPPGTSYLIQNGKTKGYWYNEGYIRTSCYEYQIQDTGNEFIHLTNDAIQVNCDKYGKYEDGNKLSYHNFQKYLDHSQKGSYRFVEDICPQLKKIAMDSIEATCHLLGDCNGLPTFQIFGLDYMIDEKFRPWLIEINTNPCLETSSATLERVIPRMVDNAFKLSLDLLFPPPQNWLNSKKHQVPSRVSNNPFELVFDESKISGGVMSSDIIMQMGEIEEDNQIY